MEDFFNKIEKNILILNKSDNKNIDRMTKLYKDTNELISNTEKDLNKLKKKFENESKKIFKIKNNNDLVEYINKFEDINNKIIENDLNLENYVKLNNDMTIIYNSINYYIKNKKQNVKNVN